MRFFQNDPTETDVTWYFVPEDRPHLPFPSAFASRNWDADLTDWPAGKRQPPAGDGTEVGEVLGAPRPWRDGSDLVHYPGTHPLGTAEQFANGLTIPPLVFEDVCDVLNTLTVVNTLMSAVLIVTDFVFPEVNVQGFMPCQGLEVLVRALFQDVSIRGTFKLHLATAATGFIGPFSTFEDPVEPDDPLYEPIPIPPDQWQISEFEDATTCYWYSARDRLYFHFAGEAFIRGAWISGEYPLGTKRLMFWADRGEPIHVPDTGGDLGIAVSALSFLTPFS